MRKKKTRKTTNQLRDHQTMNFSTTSSSSSSKVVVEFIPAHINENDSDEQPHQSSSPLFEFDGEDTVGFVLRKISQEVRCPKNRLSFIHNLEPICDHLVLLHQISGKSKKKLSLPPSLFSFSSPPMRWGKELFVSAEESVDEEDVLLDTPPPTKTPTKEEIREVISEYLNKDRFFVPNERLVEELIAMGFPRDSVITTLQASKYLSQIFLSNILHHCFSQNFF